jgi:hypothetical protein
MSPCKIFTSTKSNLYWCARFTIGVGKLSAVRMDLAAHYIDIVKHADGFNESDKEVVAELELFILLYRGIVEEHVSAKQLQSDLSQWHTTSVKCALTLRLIRPVGVANKSQCFTSMRVWS